MALLPTSKMNKIMTSKEESYGFAYFQQKYINQNLKAFTDAFTSILASFVNQCVLFLFDLNKKILFYAVGLVQLYNTREHQISRPKHLPFTVPLQRSYKSRILFFFEH